MKRTALAAVTLAAAVTAGSALAATGLWPHVYSTRIAGSQIAPLNASWRIALQQHAFSLTRNGAIAVSGSVRIAGNRITFHDLAGPLSCKGAQAAGTYTWRLAGAKLTLTRVTDSCVGRRTVLSYPFKRVA
jgi:hypothetical protein